MGTLVIKAPQTAHCSDQGMQSANNFVATSLSPAWESRPSVGGQWFERIKTFKTMTWMMGYEHLAGLVHERYLQIAGFGGGPTV